MLRRQRLVLGVLIAPVLLPACYSDALTGTSPEAWADGIALSVTYETASSGNVVALVTMTNTSADTLRGTVPESCGITFFAYRTEARTGDPVWPVDGIRRTCTLSSMQVLLPPGGSIDLGPQILGPVGEVRSDGPGMYYLTGSIQLLDPPRAVAPLPAGQVMLP